MSLTIGLPKEIHPDEKRVALTPALIDDAKKLGVDVRLDQAAYQADIILKVQAPTDEEIQLFKPNSILIGLLAPYKYPEKTQLYNQKSMTTFALEWIPRISRAQSMDVLTSQATISGYKAVVLAANISQKFFPMLSTAAGTIKPSQVLVIGAGVAGLQAIATAKRLGAVVTAYDIRAAAREQVESLGAKMVDIGVRADTASGYARALTDEEKLQQEQTLIAHIAKQDVIITTAGIPGKPAPKILTKQMVEAMAPGSLIIDIMAEFGGNCELTRPHETINHNGISIYGPVNLPSMMAHDASLLYAKNVFNFLKLFIKDGKINFDWQDQILAECVLTHDGVTHLHG